MDGQSWILSAPPAPPIYPFHSLQSVLNPRQAVPSSQKDEQGGNRDSGNLIHEWKSSLTVAAGGDLGASGLFSSMGLLLQGSDLGDHGAARHREMGTAAESTRGARPHFLSFLHFTFFAAPCWTRRDFMLFVCFPPLFPSNPRPHQVRDTFPAL